MKMYQLNCPACGATVEIEQDRKTLFCSYCGCQIHVDDGVKRVEITKHINYHKTFTDEAKIREHECKENIQIKQMEYEEREKRRDNRIIFMCIILLLSVGALSFVLGYMPEIKAKSEGKITAGYHKDLEGENYNYVKSTLEAAGFENIKLIDLKDDSFFNKDGEVESVSVGGNSSFGSSDYFDKNAEVVITYH